MTAVADAKGTMYLSDVEGASSINEAYYDEAYYDNLDMSFGEDSDLELSASHITTREPTNVPETQVILNPKGTKILKVIEPTPLAYIASARDIHFKKGKNQSRSFGKVIGAINNYIMGWVTNTGVEAATAQNASNNGVRTAEINAGTQQAAINAQPTLVPEGVTPVYSPAVR